MRRLLVMTAAVFLASGLGIPSGGAQEKEPKQVFAALVASTKKLRLKTETFKVNDAQAPELLAQLDQDAATLKNVHDRGDPAVSKDYLASLTLTIEVLQALDKERPSKEDLVRLKDVAGDLRIKVIYAAKNAKSPFDPVKAIVHTQRGAAPVPDLEVWYAPKAHADKPAHHHRFRNPSTPTDQALIPGNYILWARSPNGGALGTKTPAAVGEDGKNECKITLPAP